MIFIIKLENYYKYVFTKLFLILGISHEYYSCIYGIIKSNKHKLYIFQLYFFNGVYFGIFYFFSCNKNYIFNISNIFIATTLQCLHFVKIEKLLEIIK